MIKTKTNPNQTKLYRSHLIYILSSLGKYLFLLLIPLIRGLFYFIKSALNPSGGFHFASAFSQWVNGAWLDILAISLFISLGFLVWYLFTLETSPTGLTVRRGLFRRETFFLPTSRFTCVTMVYPFYLKPFGAVHLRIDTPGGNLNNADLVILLRKSDCNEILKAVLGPSLYTAPTAQNPSPGVSGASAINTYRPRSLYVFLLAAVTSNSFAGMLLLTTFITQVGKVLGRQFSEMIYGTFEEAAKALAFGVPPAAAAIAYLFLFSYLCAFVANLFRHGNFSVHPLPSTVEIHSGVLTNRVYFLESHKISFVDIRRTLITLSLGLSSVFLHTVGYGKYKDDVSALIPCVNKKQLSMSLNSLLPYYVPSLPQIRPRWRSAMRYLSHPLWYIGSILLASIVTTWLFTAWSDLIRWFALLGLCPALWFLAVRFADLLTAGISYQKGTFTLRYSRNFTLHTILIPREKISKITTTQSIFQRRSKRCDLRIYSYSDGIQYHRIRDLLIEDTEKLFHVPDISNRQNKRKRFQRKKK